MSIIVPELSEKGSPRQARENGIINFLQDFLQDLKITGQNEDQQMCEPLTQEEMLSQEEHWSQQTHVSLSVPTLMQW